MLSDGKCSLLLPSGRPARNSRNFSPLSPKLWSHWSAPQTAVDTFTIDGAARAQHRHKFHQKTASRGKTSKVSKERRDVAGRAVAFIYTFVFRPRNNRQDDLVNAEDEWMEAHGFEHLCVCACVHVFADRVTVCV